MSGDSNDSRKFVPRQVSISRGPSGFGFHLSCEKGRAGQFVRSVDEEGGAQKAGLRTGDRVVEVNGVNIERLTHQQVVSRVRSGGGTVHFLVVDPATDEWYREQNRLISREDIPGDAPELLPKISGTPGVRNEPERKSDYVAATPPPEKKKVLSAALPQGKKRRKEVQKGGWAERAAAFDQL
eukprot:m.19470 g.19470  ORF g.19470 m.19470 type:complete len:182 (+) comp27844_c0_seq1:85-630(+)